MRSMGAILACAASLMGQTAIAQATGSANRPHPPVVRAATEWREGGSDFAPVALVSDPHVNHPHLIDAPVAWPPNRSTDAHNSSDRPVALRPDSIGSAAEVIAVNHSAAWPTQIPVPGPSGRVPHTVIGKPPVSKAAARYVDPVFAPSTGRGIVQTAVDPAWSSDPDAVEKRALKHKIRNMTHPGGQPRFPAIDAHYALEEGWRNDRGNLRAADVQRAWKTPYSYGYFGAKHRRHWVSHQDYRDRSTQWWYE